MRGEEEKKQGAILIIIPGGACSTPILGFKSKEQDSLEIYSLVNIQKIWNITMFDG